MKGFVKVSLLIISFGISYAQTNKEITSVYLKIAKKRRLDSLSSLWEEKSKQLAIAADTIFNFNKNNYAIFVRNGKYGLLKDTSEIVIDANGYGNAIANDGFILFTNLKEETFMKQFAN